MNLHTVTTLLFTCLDILGEASPAQLSAELSRSGAALGHPPALDTPESRGKSTEEENTKMRVVRGRKLSDVTVPTSPCFR